MPKIISIHSFRGGTGKSNTTANLSAILAQKGLRVGIIDTDIQSPGIHILLGMSGDEIQHSLNDYLWGRCSIQQAAYDVTPSLGPIHPAGKLFLIPSSIKAGEIARILREGYNVNLLAEGMRDITQQLNLDILMIDTHPGLNEETLLSMALSHVLLVVMRPDQQDYEGTGVTIKVARRLEVGRLLILVNKLPAAFDPHQVQKQVEEAYNSPVAAILPHSDELMTLASAGIFAIRYPHHPLSDQYRAVADQLIN